MRVRAHARTRARVMVRVRALCAGTSTTVASCENTVELDADKVMYAIPRIIRLGA